MLEIRKIMRILFLMVSDPKKLVLEIAARVGKHETEKLLMAEGVASSTAGKLAANRYDSEIKELVKNAILRAYEAYKKAAS